MSPTLRRRGGPPPPPDPRAIAPTTGAAVPVCSRTRRGGFRASSHRRLAGPSAARYTPPTIMTRRPTVMTRRLGGHQAVWRGKKGRFHCLRSRVEDSRPGDHDLRDLRGAGKPARARGEPRLNRTWADRALAVGAGGRSTDQEGMAMVRAWRLDRQGSHPQGVSIQGPHFSD
jgi:hypothetical protein